VQTEPESDQGVARLLTGSLCRLSARVIKEWPGFWLDRRGGGSVSRQPALLRLFILTFFRDMLDSPDSADRGEAGGGGGTLLLCSSTPS
jgi:hypothetical protein